MQLAAALMETGTSSRPSLRMPLTGTDKVARSRPRPCAGWTSCHRRHRATAWRPGTLSVPPETSPHEPSPLQTNAGIQRRRPHLLVITKDPEDQLLCCAHPDAKYSSKVRCMLGGPGIVGHDTDDQG